jgi:hypothetical protein
MCELTEIKTVNTDINLTENFDKFSKLQSLENELTNPTKPSHILKTMPTWNYNLYLSHEFENTGAYIG